MASMSRCLYENKMIVLFNHKRLPEALFFPLWLSSLTTAPPSIACDFLTARR